MIEKTFVKKSFNAGAATYDDNAALQRRLLEDLLAFAGCGHLQPRRVLDIGIGTGNLSSRLAGMFPRAQIYGCDLAENMLLLARSTSPAAGLRLFAADAESLPLGARCCDLAASSFTLQWLNSLDRAMHEAMRVLRPGGLFFFSVFGEHTFQELRECFCQACNETGYDQGEALALPHTRAAADQALRRAGFASAATKSVQIIEWYDSVAGLARAIKGMGARNASARRIRTPGVRRTWGRMAELYGTRYGRQGRIPATYEVIMGRAARPR
jgi:malonyl-CoA O-methyltransferase